MILKEIAHHLDAAITILRYGDTLNITIFNALLLPADQWLQPVDGDAMIWRQIRIGIDGEKTEIEYIIENIIDTLTCKSLALTYTWPRKRLHWSIGSAVL